VSSPGIGYTLVAASSGLAPLSSSASLTFDVTSAAALATRLVVISPVPPTVAAGASFGLAFAAEDSHGNVDPSFTGSVTVALGSNPGGGTLTGITTAQFSNGLASFIGLSMNSPGTGYTLVASSGGLTPPSPGAALTFNVTSASTGSGGSSSGSTGSGGSSSGAATSGSESSDATLGLALYGYPTMVIAGNIFHLSVVVEEPGGATDTSFTGTVTLSLAGGPGGATLGGNLTMPVIHGELTFYDLSLNASGSGYIIRATASGAAPATTSPITVTDPPARLAITAAPPSILAAGQAFGLIVTVEDTSGNPDAGYGGTVTLAWAGKHGKSPLHGSLTASVVDGVARFSGLTLGKVRKGLKLQVQATASGLSPTMTNPITISLPATATPRPSRIRKARHGA
jgi:hypothetical protein